MFKTPVSSANANWRRIDVLFNFFQYTYRVVIEELAIRYGWSDETSVVFQQLQIFFVVEKQQSAFPDGPVQVGGPQNRLTWTNVSFIVDKKRKLPLPLKSRKSRWSYTTGVVESSILRSKHLLGG